MNLSQKPEDDDEEDQKNVFPGFDGSEPLDKVIFDILFLIFCFCVFGVFILYLPDILEILFPK